MRVVTAALAMIVAAAGAAEGGASLRGERSAAPIGQDLSRAFWLDVDGWSVGPLTLDMVRALARAGEVGPSSPIWTWAAQAWAPAAEVPELGGLWQADRRAATGRPSMGDREDGPARPDPRPAAGEAPPPPPAPDGENPPPPPPPEDAKPLVKYFIAVNGQTSGPFTESEIKARIDRREVTATTMMWKKGLAAWEKADQIPEIAALLAEQPARPPFDCTAYVAGVWQRSKYMQGHLVVTTTRFDANGQYSSVFAMTGLPGQNIFGTWKASAVGEKTCSIAFSQQYPQTEQNTLVFDVIGDNAMVDKGDQTQVLRIGY